MSSIEFLEAIPELDNIKVVRNPRQTTVTETGPFSEGESTREWVGLFNFFYEFISQNKEIFDELARKTSPREEICLKRLEAARRMDSIRNRIGPIDITATELVQEGRRLRQEELFGKGND